MAARLIALCARRPSTRSQSELFMHTGMIYALLANFDRRIVIGMLLIVAAGVLLSWDQAPAAGLPWGVTAIIGACLCWAIDNNLTRKVSASDPLQIAGTKGLVAGSVNLAIGLALGGAMPATSTLLVAGVVGFCGYGLSLVLFVLALRHLGAARTGAYFSAAPFAGAALSLLILHEAPGALFWIAAALMGVGIWLHMTESHAHEHTRALVARAYT